MNSRLKTRFKKFIEFYGIDESIQITGSQSLIKECFEDEDPIKFMNNYINLTSIDSDDGLKLYLDSNRNAIFFRNIKYRDYLFFNDKRIWKYFSVIKGMDHDNIQKLLTNWLNEHYPDIEFNIVGQSFKFD
jgi:hypothetical protein